MNLPKVENLISKFLINEASSEDLDFLSLWISNPKNEKLFDSYVKTHYEVTAVMSKPDVDTIKKNLLKKIQKDKNLLKNPKLITILKYAAIFVIVFGLGYLYQKPDVTSTKLVETELLIPGEDDITIEMGNGQMRILGLDEENNLRDSEGNVIGTHNKTILKYHNLSSIDNLVYNTLNVPKGKRFDVILSDGSHVYLNSETTLKYPVKFLKNRTRDIFLTGEAYFDIAEDKNHPFVVHADEMNVKVLGTKFNVTHYSENDIINTVLVEGAVELYNDNEVPESNVKLKPGYKAQWDKTSQSIKMENVDTRIYTAWLDGKLIFRNSTFKSIRHALERHYNVSIKNENTKLDEQRFDATFDIETIDEILQTFNKSYAIEYEIIDNEVLIK